ncbi:MAG: hypothetical protein ORN98_02225, partial [Alphaproteobacteria bacterium]|nr:hypothetical protein [Alphaproteobacteria bacterium]
FTCLAKAFDKQKPEQGDVQNDIKKCEFFRTRSIDNNYYLASGHFMGSSVTTKFRYFPASVCLLAILGLASFIVPVNFAEAANNEPIQGKHVTLKGEIIDSWCQVSGIMGPALGTAHHQCAIWCAVGGIPTGMMGDDGQVYIILKSDASGQNVTHPGILEIQTDHVTVDAQMFEKDGNKYVLIDAVIANDGIKNITHPEYGILPFGE